MPRITEPTVLPQVEPEDVLRALALSNAVIHATSSRSTAYAGKTIGDFIAAIRSLGFTDDDELAAIDYGNSRFTSGVICVERDERGAVEIREVRRG